jgi:hypothetical protein
MIQCATCHSAEFPGALFCGSCGAALPSLSATVMEPEREAATALPAFSLPSLLIFPPLVGQNLKVLKDVRQLRFVIGGSGRSVTVDLDRPLLIGRRDPNAGILPELDLTLDQEGERGVSRRHAIIEASDAGITLTDLNSTNGTLLNNVALPPELPYSLQDGDQIHVGNLVLHVYFQ